MKQGGFRLQHIEIYNWGTFDEKIWTLHPNGKNSLLTGANGSGKTTLVDAIITLLVPPNKRHYNQSSGAESKRERNEKTYVQGAYTRVQSEGGLGAKTKYLRTKDDFSILLGTFYNEITREYLTLLQVRWFANGDLKRSYWTIPTALTIEQHLSPLDTAGVWKKNIKKKYKGEEHDSFTKYVQAFSRKFGLKSDKAVTLFAQTVGIKVLGNLNEFIRLNMLDEHDSETEFVELREHYEHLLSSYKAIEKAREQVVLLTPIVENGVLFKEQEKKVAALTEIESCLSPYFAEKRKSLFEEAARSLEGDILKKANQITAIRNDLEQLNNQKTDLQIAISTNKVYEQIQNLDKSIQQAEREQKQREQRAKRYNTLAEKLELKTDSNETIFYRTLEKSRQEIEKTAGALDTLQQRQVEVQITQTEEINKLKVLEERLNSLQNRKNRIPIEQIRIREDLLAKLNISEKEMPFAAELMKVKDDEKSWETVIEQALRPLSMALLVPEEHYSFVLNSLSRLTLADKFTFIKVEKINKKDDKKLSKNSLIQKIKITKNHQFSEWLQQTLTENYDFECTNGYIKIPNYERSLSDRGLWKNGDLHYKNDTPSGTRHVMGWDNRETIIETQKEAKNIEKEITKWQRALDDYQHRYKAITIRRDDLNKLIGFEQYEEIDWKSLAKNVKDYEGQKGTLVKSSNHLRELETQLTEKRKQVQTVENSRDKLTEQRGNLQSRLENYKQELKEVEEILVILDVSKIKKNAKRIEAHLDDDTMMISTIKKIENKITRKIQEELSDLQRETNKTDRKLSLAMQKFINPSAEILEKYPNWMAETVNLGTDIKYLKEFELIYNKIQTEELPKYEKRFKDWLNERLIFDIANFKTSLENKEVQILESIDEINESLNDINFNTKPLTYIQLDVHKSRDNAIRDFKEMLKDAMPDPAKLVQGDAVELEKSFKRIQKIIEELSDNEPWRKKVTDVRNWLEFAAIERYRADNSERQYYQDSQSLSGGEKAKLAYTILASAIAYQFGIRNENSDKRSFRFAVVDEAFSKVDPENSVYAMELFKQLNLQLMVVTPLDKINLAEPYIHSVHFVQNNNKKNSEVFDLPMEVYNAQKAAFSE
jgi:uncharacterized protein YPO0396